MALSVRAWRVKEFAIVIRVTSDVKQAAWEARASDEVFVGMEVGADVARERMPRRNVKKLVLEKGMFCGLVGRMNGICGVRM